LGGSVPNWEEEQELFAEIAQLKDQLQHAQENLKNAIDCGEDNTCGTVGYQCQKCLRLMFHREVSRVDDLKFLYRAVRDAKFHTGLGTTYVLSSDDAHSILSALRIISQKEED
jgi:hypothetical protein